MTVHARSRARSWALHLLYAWDLAGSEESPGPFARVALERRRMARRYRKYALALVDAVDAHLVEIDAAIAEHAANWRLERLGAVERNILRIGVAELRWVPDVPPKVAIHEAMRLATRYGGDDSTGFVNAVLDAVHKEDAPAG